MGDGQNKDSQSDADEKVIQPRLEAEAIQFEQGNRPDGDQEEREGPWRKMDDDEVDGRNQCCGGIEPTEIKVSRRCR